MIVLEGPDGSGKTTLLKQLCEVLNLEQGPRASTSLGGPVENLRRWVDQDMETWPRGNCLIYDRYPLISEAIYGPVMRHNLPSGFDNGWYRYACRKFRQQTMVIFCLPPLPTVLSNMDVEPQLEGVREAMHGIYWGYHVMGAQWTGNAYTFDYTKDPMSALLAKAKMHKDRWY